MTDWLKAAKEAGEGFVKEAGEGDGEGLGLEAVKGFVKEAGEGTVAEASQTAMNRVLVKGCIDKGEDIFMGEGDKKKNVVYCQVKSLAVDNSDRIMDVCSGLGGGGEDDGEKEKEEKKEEGGFNVKGAIGSAIGSLW